MSYRTISTILTEIITFIFLMTSEITLIIRFPFSNQHMWEPVKEQKYNIFDYEFIGLNQTIRFFFPHAVAKRRNK